MSTTYATKAAAKTAVTSLGTTPLQNIATAAVDLYLALMARGSYALQPDEAAFLATMRANLGHIAG